MSIVKAHFVGKQINEIQLYSGICVINFTYGSYLEINPLINDYGTSVTLEYEYTEPYA